MPEPRKKYREVGKTLDAWSRFLILDELLAIATTTTF